MPRTTSTVRNSSSIAVQCPCVLTQRRKCTAVCAGDVMHCPHVKDLWVSLRVYQIVRAQLLL
jgi:hypothetical protein